jgi:hypothetical protein
MSSVSHVSLPRAPDLGSPVRMGSAKTRLFLHRQQFFMLVRYQRKSNRKLHQNFKEDACLRSILELITIFCRRPPQHLYYQLLEELLRLWTSLGYTVHEKCKKIRGVSKIAVLVSSTPMSACLQLYLFNVFNR